ncbi:entericidin [Rhizobiaceae bacterium]|nr:entericidin [Rhizobiaceae bacterium]
MRSLNIALSATLVGSVLMLSGCANTIRGVGQDASNTVNATQGAVRRTGNAVSS